MELLYVYIDKYRNFSKQGIHFSNKFKLSYSESEQKLTIDKNEDYIDIYPQNIAGITAIIGMNASGKTSLLDLVGTRINSELRDGEKKQATQEDELEKTDEESSSKAEIYESSYFLIYYAGEDKGNDTFVFESNTPNKYIKIFDDAQSMQEKLKKYVAQTGFTESKDWFSYIFEVVNKKLVLNLGLYIYKHGHSISILSKACMLLFKNNFKTCSYFDDYNHILNIGPVMSIKRHNATLQSSNLYNQIEFLINQMKGKSPQLYKSSEYKLIIYATMYMPRIDGSYSIVKTQKNFCLKNLTKEQEFTLSFLYSYISCMFANLVGNGDGFSQGQDNCISKLIKYDKCPSTYEDIKEYYQHQIKIIFKFYDDREFQLDEYTKKEKGLENLFKKATECNIGIDISCERNQLTLVLSKETRIEAIASFFFDAISDLDIKNMQNIFDTNHVYFRTNINFLSEGEKAKLAMYTSIDELIRASENEHPRPKREKKEKYILLFDEMEQSMHPEMCRKLLSSLMDFLGGYPEKKFQIIIASHSPFIISDILKENLICLENKGIQHIVKSLKENTFGQNIHTLLKNEFFLENTYGEYSKKFIQKIASWLIGNKDLAKEINDFLNTNTDNERRKEVVSTPDEAYDYLEKVITCIGEPILRDYLQEQLEKHMNAEDEIKYLEKKLEKAKEAKKLKDEEKEIKDNMSNEEGSEDKL